MAADTYITASCIISNNVVYKNGQPLYQHKDVDMGAFLIAAYNHFEVSYPKFYKMDYLSKLGLISTEVLLKPDFDATKYKPEDIGIVMTNASASLDADTKYFETVKDIPSPALFVYTLPNILIGEICIKNKFKGENVFFVFEKFDADFLEQYVTNLFSNNILKACICGWIEVWNNEYKAVLYLVEKENYSSAITFTKENLKKIYETENG